MADYAQVTAADAIGLVERDEVWLLDVREPHEWALGHAAAAHHIPMGSIGERQDELPRDAAILVVCHSGVRSAMVVQALDGAGYETANIEAGMTAWAAAGGDVVDDEGRPGRID
ncbi:MULTISPECIES: rhodanese-like domain-containing protein [unclassified Rathayibacter]|uniref:rhodanese-like domain-containing protein n=1 Tax=unclassified Rathayibacter TaxID=2609250 RepID=UPI00104FDE40|nr:MULTISPECIES: rhodanese-like domain-containing protein [unclassified Rathayibacter]MCJ1674287.1 rhodanese-like domain-containing protein [Rathayibacter sp. VKM Ac-2929]MCJ1684568.1 rhodanese-like domain-containing protein [Rathayibacter sp. VKM Ac-2928]TCL83860.1 rhodanese-related sulfurtransferase [Rathayibacter sp. PhB192]TCM29453.1 rhodanese-related sulfurtransferase [Rathayibacter sp. PhB179]